ncbi:MAG: hypothetical protein ABJB11_00335 [Ferruginibacter sp.]
MTTTSDLLTGKSQKNMNKAIAKAANCETITAYINGVHVSTLLKSEYCPDTLLVSNEMFISLACLCNKVGRDTLASSPIFEMMFHGASKAKINREIISMMQNNNN